MASYPPITIRQPQVFDLVDDPVEVCGIATGFEGRISARVRDGNLAELAFANVSAGGTQIWGNFHASLPLGTIPATPQGTLEVFELAASGDGTELNKVVVPITFGRALLDPYHGFGQHLVTPGQSLWAIAQQWYGDGALWPRLYEANRDQLSNPNLIYPGQVLRIPQ